MERVEKIAWVAMMTSIVAPMLIIWITFCLKASVLIWQAKGLFQ